MSQNYTCCERLSGDFNQRRHLHAISQGDKNTGPENDSAVDRGTNCSDVTLGVKLAFEMNAVRGKRPICLVYLSPDSGYKLEQDYILLIIYSQNAYFLNLILPDIGFQLIEIWRY